MRQLFEGGIVSLLGARIQPVDIARRLADHMEDNRRVGAGRLYVPNRYRVYMAPETLADFSEYESGLEDELATFLSTRARESKFSFIGRVNVKLMADPAMKRERLRIDADLVDGGGNLLDAEGQSQHTAQIQLPKKSARNGPPNLILRFGSRSIPLLPNMGDGTSGTKAAGSGPDKDSSADSNNAQYESTGVSIGRALDNDLILDEVSVSRHHARISARGANWMLEDQGSTHGSFINGHQVTASLLRPGDRIQLGSVILELVPMNSGISDQDSSSIEPKTESHFNERR